MPELASLNVALNRTSAGLKQIAGAQANTAHNLNAEQAIAGKSRETFFTIYDVDGGIDASPPSSNAAGMIEGKTRNHIGKSGLPVQSMERTHMALTSDRCFFPVKDNDGNLFYTRVGSFKPNGSNLYANQFGMILQYAPADDAGNLPATVSSGDLQPLSMANHSMNSITSDSITVGAGLGGAIGDIVRKNFNVIDASGTPRTLVFNFERINLPAGSTNAQAWRLVANGPTGSTVQGDAASPYGNPAFGLVIEFDGSGKPAAFRQGDGLAGYSAPFANLPTLNISWPGGVAPSIINLNLGNIGQTNGVMTINGGQSFLKVVSNGHQAGTLNSMEFDENGRIYGSFSNGQSKFLGRLALGILNNPDAMLPTSNACYLPTSDNGIGDDYSGSVSFEYAGENATGQIAVGALEGSNVDVITEMSRMVQRELQFSVITTASHTTKNMWGEMLRAVKS
jgi:flagellar hook protein FlgE